MYTIIFKGRFETDKQEEFVNKLQTLLKETDTEFLGQVQSFEMPPYVDYQKIESNNEGQEINSTKIDESSQDNW